MKKLYCVICGKYRKYEKPKIHFLEKTLVFFIICNKCPNKDEKIFSKNKLYNYFKNMTEANISQEFRLKNIDETRNYFLEEIKQNELMSRKHKMVCATLNYIEHFHILGSTITGCSSISAFTSLTAIPIEITSSAIGLKIC